jgi:hypothetical protein
MATTMRSVFEVVIIVAAAGEGSGVVKDMLHWCCRRWSRLGRGEQGGDRKERKWTKDAGGKDRGGDGRKKERDKDGGGGDRDYLQLCHFSLSKSTSRATDCKRKRPREGQAMTQANACCGSQGKWYQGRDCICSQAWRRTSI